MSPQAVTLRLKQTSELRRLCLALAGGEQPLGAGGQAHLEHEETRASAGNARRPSAVATGRTSTL
ncbi:MAG: hypothetical protein GW880_22080 [Armatimonadetes bacterium]|nr:hypothetical protein [Armatimonadota bacterium]